MTGPTLMVLTPRAMAARKPRHGAPCNRCGVCCWSFPCELGRAIFEQEVGPCPALKFDGVTASCGLMADTAIPAPLREAAAVLIGANTGCDARINGEPRDMAFVVELERLDEVNAAAIRAARDAWELDGRGDTHMAAVPATG